MGRIQAHMAILAANILFSLNYSYSKSLIPGFLAPETLCMVRIGCAAVVFALVGITMVRERIRWSDLGWLALAALFGTGGNQYIFLQGLQYTSPVDAAIISVTGPVLVLVISAILGRDRITWFKSIGIAVGASGALLTILYGGIANFGSGHLTGNILVFLAALSYAGYLVVVTLKHLCGPLLHFFHYVPESLAWGSPELNRIKQNAVEKLERTYKDHQVQLADHFRTNLKLQHVIAGSAQTPPAAAFV